MKNKQGLIIVLYGAPAAGKTTIARALQELSEEPLYLLGLDAWAENIMPSKFYFGREQEKGFSCYSVDDELRVKFGPIAQQSMKAFHQMVGELALRGHSVVLDHIFLDEEWLKDCEKYWKGLSVIWVHLDVPLDELIRREAQRKKIGENAQAHLQYCVRCLHKNMPQSLKINTAQISPEESAKLIYRQINKKI
ncbi:TPA: hypothetical protein DIC20_02380 [Candidatus Dependentiae bacterium]|nr:MAG: hypothetical protein US03_C0003G0033 [candidate division TM6 bacterium GW2011_GWF2_36_131]KKQ03352.1 MAG: hypothetical protein US13_C0003G0033 [candidate division TM6 bacterium GW2011_GWE2_36_25]KKQ19748.1 MAG: hypothetical protein US32_C0005G0032 [candidate division TM6 bacterium GW2011_GWA2_36_9]HBR70870.1 hypothetical protein [Candidatus Dependentiae bacterium]HCU00527.1 hypothetical protein [Candidatus Dependentiae bacterium]